MTRSLKKFRSGYIALAVIALLASYGGIASAQTTTTTIPGRTLVPNNGALAAAGSNPAVTPGCDQLVFNGLKNSGTFSYAQGYAASYSLIHQPTTFFGCINGLLNSAQSLLNMFNGTGNISLSGLFQKLATAAVGQLLTQLSNQVCSIVNGAISTSGIPGLSSVNGMAGGSGAGANLLSFLNPTPTP